MVGATALTAGALALLHLIRSSPDQVSGWSTAAGAIGRYVATPFTEATSIWVSAPVLTLLVIFGLLVVTATPINTLPSRGRQLLDFAFGPPVADEETETVSRRARIGKRGGVDPFESDAEDTDEAPIGELRRSARRRHVRW